jgi:hypothetical protein
MRSSVLAATSPAILATLELAAAKVQR